MKILDTCAFLWVVLSPSNLSEKALSAIKDETDNCVLSVTAWEIAVKARSGKLRITSGMSPLDMFQTALKDYSLREIVVDSKIFCSSVGLPMVHRDPCDRMIIAAALLHNCPVVTADKIFCKYPGLEVIW